MSAIPIITVTCHYCGGARHPREIVNIGSATLMCWHCYEKHTVQVEAFNPPNECQECHRTFEQIAAATPGGTVSMFPHWKDGQYQILCRPCSDAYVESNKQLYRDTPFGWANKLK